MSLALPYPSSINIDMLRLSNRVLKNDRTLTKLKFIYPPKLYNNNNSNEVIDNPFGNSVPTTTTTTDCDNNNNNNNNNGSKNYLDVFCTRVLKSGNTNITSVTIEKRFFDSVTKAEFEMILNALCGGLQCLKELEIWSVEVPLHMLCQAVAQAKELVRLGFGFMSLLPPPSSDQQQQQQEEEGLLSDDDQQQKKKIETDIISVENAADALRFHPSLRKFYLSEFNTVADGGAAAARVGFQSNEINNDNASISDNNNNNDDDDDESNDASVVHEPAIPHLLDSLLSALATCPVLQEVEFFSYHGLIHKNNNVTEQQQQQELLLQQQLLLQRQQERPQELQVAIPQPRTIQPDIMVVEPFTPSGLAKLVSESKSLQRLTLRRLGLHSDHAICVANALSNMENNHSNLKYITFHENHIGDEGCASFGKALGIRYNNNKNSTAIQELDMRYNHITDIGCKSFCDQLMSTLRMSNASKLHDGQCSQLQQHNNNKEEAALNPRTAKDQNGIINIGLEKLNFAMNRIGDVGAQSLSELLSSIKLKHLILHRTNITNTGCLYLSTSLKRNDCKLTKLGLSHNHFTEEGYMYIIDALTINRSIKTINLQVYKKLNISVLVAIVQMLMDKNFVVESIDTLMKVKYDPLRYYENKMLLDIMNVFLKLNQLGRQRLVLGGGQGQAVSALTTAAADITTTKSKGIITKTSTTAVTIQDWVNTLVSIRNDNINGLYFLIRTNPMLFCHAFHSLS